MPLDADALARLPRRAGQTAHQLCRAELERFRAAAADGGAVVGCTQEAPLFSEVAGERAGIAFVNVRETAGWSATPRRPDQNGGAARGRRRAAAGIPFVSSTAKASR